MSPASLLLAPYSDGWRHSPDAETGGRYLRAALAAGWGEGQRALLLHDLDLLRARLRHLRAVFPPHTLHALAIKANSLVRVLEVAVAEGCGLECASIEEVALARAAGCPDPHIVFDSPAKTLPEMGQALGVTLNADNLVELERLHGLLHGCPSAGGRFGLRINPQTGAGRIGTTSVAGSYSKFGVPLTERREEIIAAFARHPFLSGLHVHIGSQGTSLSPLVEAVRRAFDLRREIESRLPGRRIAYIDLGGGLPWRYVEADPQQPTPEEYWAALAERVPETATGEVALMTEFGRAVQAPCGIAASRVEYVKDDGGVRTAVLHLGADFILRRVYNPTDWRHRFSVLDPEGRPRGGEPVPVHLAGPLCFGGDFLARDEVLPAIQPGDWVLIHDVGAYTLSMWSRHCSRGIPRVLGVEGGAGAEPTCRLLREAESQEDLCRYWS